MDRTTRGLRERYGEWALVTGASSGIGRSLARELAADGLSIVLVSNQADALEETAAALRREFRVEAVPCCVDLASGGFLERVRDAVTGRSISVLVNNASFGTVGEFLTHPLDRYEELIDVNVGAYVALTHEFLPRLRAARRGALVFVSSINALQPIAKSAVYTASKAFEMYFGCALSNELQDSGVDVLVVLPGPTRTGFQQIAGTRVAPWAMEPDDVAREALAALGREMVHVAGAQNRLLAGAISRFSIEHKVGLASQFLEQSLLTGDTSSGSLAPGAARHGARRDRGEQPRMTRSEFLSALEAQLRSYLVFDAALQRVCEPGLARLVHMDPLARAGREQFGAPLAEWFPIDGGCAGVHLEDATLIFDIPPQRTVYLLPPSETPDAHWRTRAEVLGRFELTPAVTFRSAHPAHSAISMAATGGRPS